MPAAALTPVDLGVVFGLAFARLPDDVGVHVCFLRDVAGVTARGFTLGVGGVSVNTAVPWSLNCNSGGAGDRVFFAAGVRRLRGGPPSSSALAAPRLAAVDRDGATNFFKTLWADTPAETGTGAATGGGGGGGSAVVLVGGTSDCDGPLPEEKRPAMNESISSKGLAPQLASESKKN